MKFITARQAWHDAFDTPTTAFDFEAISGNSTERARTRRRAVEYIRDGEGKIIGRIPSPVTCAVETVVGKGSAARIMDGCEKGLVQSVIARIRRNDPLAYCWGMAAYAPPASRFRERASLLQYLLAEFDKWDEPHDRTLVGMLAMFAINACALRDVNGRHVDLRQARTILGCDKAAWDRDWKRIWQRMQRRLDDLPARALGPVADFVENYQERCRAS